MKKIKSNVTRVSPRELACLQLLAQGYSFKQTAEKLSVKMVTCRTFIQRLKEKFEADSLPEVVKKACHEGIL